MSKIENGIYREPVNEIVGKLNDNIDKNILLTGVEQGGKSVVLNEFMKQQNKEIIIIDASVKNGEFMRIHDKLFNLYHVCLVVQKMILHLQKTSPDDVYLFDYINQQTRDLLSKINLICTLGFADSEDKYVGKYIDKYILETPESLIHNFIRIALFVLDYQQVTLILDNFDVVGESSIQYQQFMYNTLKQFEKLKFVATVSSEEVLNNYDSLENLRGKECMINVGYSFDKEIVKTIIDDKIEEMIKPSKLLSDRAFGTMILLTNGNLMHMELAIRYLYSILSMTNQSDYESELIKYITNVINKNPIITGNAVITRKLHI